MNVSSILDYKRDPAEEYYKLLGCDRFASSEQISTEFKIRAKECHPDKSVGRNESNPERFQQLLTAKNTLLDEKERSFYDTWLDSGINVSFKNWRGLKGTVKTSMHWATPKTDRMIKSNVSPQKTNTDANLRKEKSSELKSVKESEKGTNLKSKDILGSQSSDQVLEKDPMTHDETMEKMAQDNDNDDPDDGITYDPTQYENLKYRVDTPPPEWEEDELEENSKSTTKNISQKSIEKKEITQTPRTQNNSEESGTTTVNRHTNTSISMRRKQFATRRESSIGAMVMTHKFDDGDIRRKFRNYEI